MICLIGCSRSNEDALEEVKALQSEGAVEASIPILVELIEAGSRDGEVLYRYGRALSMLGQPARSVWALDAALEDPDWFVVASQQLALDSYRAGNLDLTLQVFERLRAENREAYESDVVALLLEARAFVETGRHYPEALERAEAIIEKFPEREEAVRIKAAALLALKRPDEAFDLIRKVGMPLEDEPFGVGQDEALAAEGDPEGAGSDADGGEPNGAAGDEGEKQERGITTEKRDAYWCGVRVSYQREAGLLEEAAAIADECLAKYPTSLDLIGEAIKVYPELGRTDRILGVLEAAHREDPENGQILDALVQAYEGVGSSEAAEGVLRAALERATRDEQALPAIVASRWTALGAFLAEHERAEDAIAAFAEAIELLGDGAGPTLLFRQAEAMTMAKQYDEALKLVEKMPTEVHGPMLKGRIAFERGQYSDALELLDQAAILWPDNAPIRYYLARTAEGIGDFGRAIEEYRQAIRADATLSEARERLTKLHLAEGNVREAATILQFQSPKMKSTPSVPMRVLAVEVDALFGREPNLEIQVDRGGDIHALRRDTVRALSRGLRGREELGDVQEVLSRLARQANAQVQGFFIRERVELLLLDGRVEEARTAAREALAESPKDPDIQLALAKVLVRSGEELDEARSLLLAFREDRPLDVEGLVSLGDLALARGAADEAQQYFDQALELDAGCWPAMSRRVTGLVASGKRDEAIDRLSSFVAREAPFNGDAALALGRLLDPDRERTRSIRLAQQAIRFGAGPDALELLVRLDPTAAARYSVQPTAPRPADRPAEGPAEAAPAKAGSKGSTTASSGPKAS